MVQHGQCPDCTKLAAKNTWQAVIQVRQKVPHKRTFLFLEQLILKHNAHKDTISIKEVKDGLDFYYAQESHAQKMVEFLASMVPVQFVFVEPWLVLSNLFQDIAICPADIERHAFKHRKLQVHPFRADNTYLQGRPCMYSGKASPVVEQHQVCHSFLAHCRSLIWIQSSNDLLSSRQLYSSTRPFDASGNGRCVCSLLERAFPSACLCHRSR